VWGAGWAGFRDPAIPRARFVPSVLGSSQLPAAMGGASAPATPAARPAEQLALFAPTPPHPVLDRLRATDPNTVTPLEALALLAQLAAEAKEESAS